MLALEEQSAALEREKAELSTRLQGALSQVADTQKSARGMIVSLPDILFDINEATLKNEAKIVIAKLAGILLILPELNLRVEGHTDSTGSADYNQGLSERRAAPVRDFLAQQGIGGQRMISVGYGLTRPVADNSTREGRARNRRVEIVIAEGVTVRSVTLSCSPRAPARGGVVVPHFRHNLPRDCLDSDIRDSGFRRR